MTTQPQIKNPGLAAVLSFLIPGLGQIYNGEVGKGIIIIVVQVVNALLMLVVIGFFTGFAVLVWAVYDAYKTAERINAQAAQQDQTNTKTCPQCAERVQSGAKVCRYCGYEFVPAQAALPTPVKPVKQLGVESSPVEAQPAGAAAAKKICSHCGGENAPDAQFCKSCGHSFTNETVEVDASAENTME